MLDVILVVVAFWVGAWAESRWQLLAKLVAWLDGVGGHE